MLALFATVAIDTCLQGFSPPKQRMPLTLLHKACWASLNILCVILFSLHAPAVNAVSTIQINFDILDSPAGQLKETQLQVNIKGTKPKLQLTGEAKPHSEQMFMPFSIQCGTLLSDKAGYIDCFDGELKADLIQAPFSAHLEHRQDFFAFDMLFNGANFSDTAGLHAGEGLVGDLQFNAYKKQKGWHWDGKVSWDQGEVFWQPFYFGQAGNVFQAHGEFQQQQLLIDYASLNVVDVGEIKASAHINTQTKQLEDVVVSADDVDFHGLYTLLLQPKLARSAFGNLTVSGKASWQFAMQALQPTSFTLTLSEANIEDQNGKFAFYNVNANIPWDYDVPKPISLQYQKGQLLNMPLATTQLNAQVNRYALTSPELVLPIFNGALRFKDVSAAWLGENWFWHLRMDLDPISLNQFSTALGWPEMEGDISGQVPLVTYASKQLNMDGAMRFHMFDGTVSMNNLRIDDPLGVVTRMYADLAIRNIDLGEITRTFSFGDIKGKMDGDVKGLVLENWKAMRFDAVLATNDDEQEKKISQRAVENITALGGQGTAAALQRTFLRFFDEFNYDKIGISCKLRNDVCEMGGVASTPDGYIIVKGSGIPAVNVNGYTKTVSLSDLIARIKRVISQNTEVIVK